MSEYRFAADRESFVYVSPSADNYYGHLYGYFNLRRKGSATWKDAIRVTLESQIGTSLDGSGYDDQRANLYGVKFTVGGGLPLDSVDDLAYFSRRLSKLIEERELVYGDGFTHWCDLLNAGIDAFGINHAHVYQQPKTYMSIPDTPYFGNIKTPFGRAKLLDNVRAVYEGQLATRYVRRAA